MCVCVCCQSEEVLTKYLEEKNVVGKTIRAADRSLTEAQKKMEGEGNVLNRQDFKHF